MNKRWEDRISSVESELKRPKEGDVDIFSAIHSCEDPMDVGENSCVKNKRRKKAATSLSTVWYGYTREPRIWMYQASRQQVYSSRKTVAYMKLLLEKGYSSYRTGACILFATEWVY